MRLLLCLAVLAAWVSPAAAQTRSVVLHVPARDFGILVGDVLTTEAVITVDPAAVLDWRTVPVAGPVDAAIELRHVQLTDTLANGARTIIIKLDYQSFFAPDRVMQTELPASTIGFVQGGKSFTAKIPAWPYHVSPLRVPERATDNLADLRGDHLVPAVSLRWAELWVAASAAIMAVASLVLAGCLGLLPGLVRASHPFAQAARRIARLDMSGPNRELAFKTLHRAFDATAGRRVQPEDIDAFLRQHPRYAALRTEIIGFFAASTDFFFSPAGSAQTLPALRPLAKKLRRAERAW